MGKSKMILAAIIGASAGALTALLLAPSSGDELRRQLADGARDQADRLKDAALDRLSRLKDAALERVDNILAKAENSLSEAEEAALEDERA